MAFPTKVHYVRFSGSGGELSILGIPADGRGVPTRATAATYGISDLRYQEDDAERVIVSAGTAATLDTVDTTTSGASGSGQADRTLVTVASATGITEGHRYMLTDATTSRRELVTVDRIDGGNVYMREPLVDVYATASTFQGVEFTATFDSTEAADEERLDDAGGPYAIDWVWTGVDPTRQREMVWVRRHPELPWFVSLGECARVDPTLRDQLANIPGASDGFLLQAHEDLWAELAAVSIDPHNWDGGRNAIEYIKHRWAYRGRKQLPGEDGEFNDRMAREHLARAQSLRGTFITRGKNPVGTVTPDRDEDQAESGTSTTQPNGLFALT